MRVRIDGLNEMKKALTKKKVAVEKVASAVTKEKNLIFVINFKIISCI